MRDQALAKLMVKRLAVIQEDKGSLAPHPERYYIEESSTDDIFVTYMHLSYGMTWQNCDAVQLYFKDLYSHLH